MATDAVPSGEAPVAEDAAWNAQPLADVDPPPVVPRPVAIVDDDDDTPCEILSVSFNQDYQCVAVGTSNGFRIYNCDPFKRTFRREPMQGGIGLIEMLFRCNILALVGGGRNPRYPPNKVMIWDDHQSRCIGELSFRSEVRRVRLRRDRIIVVLDQKIYVYNFADLKLLDHIETVRNPDGLCSVCALPASNVLVCPGLQRGHVRVELYSMESRPTTLIPAHESAISALATNSDGSLCATASQKGTLLRIWDTSRGALVQEVRRGADRARVTSIAFNADSTFLVASSDKGTVHIFRLSYPQRDDHPEPVSVGGGHSSSSSLGFVKGYLPKYFSSEWSHSRFRVPDTDTIVAFGTEPNTIIVVSTQGMAYKAKFNPDVPGECTQESCVQFCGNIIWQRARANPAPPRNHRI
ncbi:WD domain, G-beta repeat [Plasmodiophora brassicae]